MVLFRRNFQKLTKMVTFTVQVNEPLDETALDETSLALCTSYVVETNIFEILP